ncbi:MAG: putative FAD-dependent dehydrogenase [Myxococcota bacterium]
MDDFVAGRPSEELPRTSYPRGVQAVDLSTVLPTHLVDGIRAGLAAFERTVPGFASSSGVLIAPETRTTSPVRFLRNDDYVSTTLPGLYPSGEGAGYGGGIVSCALDGMRVGRAIAQSFGAVASE